MAGGQRSRRTRPSTRPSWVFFLFIYFIMPDSKDESEGSRMIREIQEQRRREESAEANSMIRQIQAQQKLARHLMRLAETRTRVKPPPSRRQLTKKYGKVFRGYNGLLSNHLEHRQQRVDVRDRLSDILGRKNKNKNKTKKTYGL